MDEAKVQLFQVWDKNERDDENSRALIIAKDEDEASDRWKTEYVRGWLNHGAELDSILDGVHVQVQRLDHEGFVWLFGRPQLP